MSEITREQVIEKVNNRVSLACFDLSGINLSGANLSKANLRWTNLRGSNLNNADLSDVNFFGADFYGVKGVTRLSLARDDDAIIHKSTAYKNPSGIRVIISCHNHTLEYWQANYKKIGMTSKYSLEDIESYKKAIEDAIETLTYTP